MVTRFQKEPHGKWWDAVPTDATASDLAPILDDLSCRRALTAALELGVEMCFQAYDDAGRVESLERWLMTRRENLRLTESPSGARFPRGSPARGCCVRSCATRRTAATSRPWWTRSRPSSGGVRVPAPDALLDRKVCITWRGVDDHLFGCASRRAS